MEKILGAELGHAPLRVFSTENLRPSDVGEWDQVSVGVDGTLHALKNDKMLPVQFITSPADLDAAARLVGLAMARF